MLAFVRRRRSRTTALNGGAKQGQTLVRFGQQEPVATSGRAGVRPHPHSEVDPLTTSSTPTIGSPGQDKVRASRRARPPRSCRPPPPTSFRSCRTRTHASSSRSRTSGDAPPRDRPHRRHRCASDPAGARRTLRGADDRRARSRTRRRARCARGGGDADVLNRAISRHGAVSDSRRAPPRSRASAPIPHVPPATSDTRSHRPIPPGSA